MKLLRILCLTTCTLTMHHSATCMFFAQAALNKCVKMRRTNANPLINKRRYNGGYEFSGSQIVAMKLDDHERRLQQQEKFLRALTNQSFQETRDQQGIIYTHFSKSEGSFHDDSEEYSENGEKSIHPLTSRTKP